MHEDCSCVHEHYLYAHNNAHAAKLKRQAREESERTASEVSGEKVKGREMNLHQLKRERDYRRRRQKYRARNVHITRRTPAQVNTRRRE